MVLTGGMQMYANEGSEDPVVPLFVYLIETRNRCSL